MKQAHSWAFESRAVHAGEKRSPIGGQPVVTPIYPSVGYTFEHSRDLDAVLGDELPGYVYSTRYANPTVAAFEAAVAELEGTEAAIAFSSGMAAVHMALLAAGVRANSSVVAAADVYGATYTLLKGLFTELGARVHFVDVTEVESVDQTVADAEPAALFVETVSNPLLKVADLGSLAAIARKHSTFLLVDNTFCTPYLCKPAGLGAEMVIHSATKFLAGHGDVMGGVIATSAQLKERLQSLNKLVGSSLGPFEAWLAHRGLKTLPIRMERQCRNALAVAGWLEGHPKVEQVRYPGLPTHPQQALMNQLSRDHSGAVVAFEIAGADKEQVFAFMDSLELVQPATSLGDIYSLVLYPAISSHRSLTPAARARLGITERLVRLSVGIEAPEDIQADLEQALAIV